MKTTIVQAGGPGSGPHKGSVAAQARSTGISAGKSSNTALQDGDALSHTLAANDHERAYELHSEAGKQSESAADKNYHAHQAEFHRKLAESHRTYSANAPYPSTKATQAKGEIENLITATGTGQGAFAGHGTRNSKAADAASTVAKEATFKAQGPMGKDDAHKEAAQLHQVASDAHAKAMVAHTKAGNLDKAKEHASAMVCHDAACEAHGVEEPDEEVVEAADKAVSELDFVTAGGPGSGRHPGNSSVEHRENLSERGFESTRQAGINPTIENHQKALEDNKKAAAVFGKNSSLKIHHEQRAEDHAAAIKKLSSGGTIEPIPETIKLGASTPSIRDIIHCRASGSKLNASKPWVQDESVKFCYMPGGVHTITAGFCGPITKGRNSSIALTVEVDPDRDAPVCQASMAEIKAESPKQDLYGCFEHDEKQASVWAEAFESGEDPVHGEPCILLAAKPSEGGAKAVNGKDWRSWSPSFGTNAEYGKCLCRRCDEKIQACECASPAFYFPEGARGSASKPANITGIDFVLGTLTNKPAFRAMPPVKAKQAEEVVTAGGPGSGRHSSGYESGQKDELDMPRRPQDLHWAPNSNSASAERKTNVSLKKDSPVPHSEAADAHKEAALTHYPSGHMAAYHNAMSEYHNAMDEELKEQKVKSADSFSDLDTILAACKRTDSVDEILARLEPGASRVTGFAADLDAMDALLATLSGREEEVVLAGGPGSGRHKEGNTATDRFAEYEKTLSSHAASNEANKASEKAEKTGLIKDHQTAATLHFNAQNNYNKNSEQWKQHESMFLKHKATAATIFKET